MGCRANKQIAGKRVGEIFSDEAKCIGLNGDDQPIFIGRNRSDLYDLASESPNNANGDLTSKVDASGTTTYDYDALGNLRKVTPPSGSAIDYVIDGANRRVGKKVGGVLVQQFLYASDLRIVAELNGSGALVSRFVYGTRLNVPEYVVKGSNTYRVVTDHLGSVRRVVDVSSGAVAQAIEYDEFGVVLSDSAPGFQPFGFAGGLNGDGGFVRFGKRDYEPRTSRWTTKDPAGFRGGLNLYGYIVGDPINGIDPFGLYPPTPGGIWDTGRMVCRGPLAGIGMSVSGGAAGGAVGAGAGLALMTLAAAPTLMDMTDLGLGEETAGVPDEDSSVEDTACGGDTCGSDPWTTPDNDNDPDAKKRRCLVKAANAEAECLRQGKAPGICNHVWMLAYANCLAGVGS